ncbi:MAG: winged helix-turn-helix transcriptional regulator [Methanobacteriota archaeon]|nr:MAG: winged helix-turn-helix transcriptional regulator [Euryarchaeota archaeon]
MKAFKVIDDPEAFQLLADETRRRVVYLLRAKEMTVSQIAAELNLTPQAIYHHIRKLKDAGMIEIAREERVDHFIETYYRASAEVFHLAHGHSKSSAVAERNTAEALKVLPRLGFAVEARPETVSKLVELERRLDEIGEKSEWTDKISGLDDVDFITRMGVAHYAKMLSMSDDEFNEYLKLSKEWRKVIRQTLLEPPTLASKKG